MKKDERDRIYTLCGRTEEIAQALDVVLTLDNEEDELLTAVLALVEAARGTRWQLRWIGGAPGQDRAWLTVVVEMPKTTDDDPRMGPFVYPAAAYEDAVAHAEELLAISGHAHDRFFPSIIGDWSGRWRLEPVPGWVMESIGRQRDARAAKRAAKAKEGGR